MNRRPRLGLKVLAGAIILLLAGPVQARDAAFLDPGATGSDQAIKVEPKEEVDTGETVLNVAKRVALFFVNETNQPIQIEKVVADSDGNVTADVTNDDCSKQGTLAPMNRCSIEVSVTPKSPGSWSVDVLMTHNGPGRLTRAKLTGKTSGETKTEEKHDTGLALNTKEANPVNFGDVEADGGKAVRSALMVNDSPDPITLYSIDVIEPGNGLTRLDQGCAVDMELKPGESCPVTLLWAPTESGIISTDLIIRHSGKLGFAVIPIRGTAKGGKDDGKSASSSSASGSKSGVPAPPTPADLEKASLDKIAPVSSKTLDTAATAAGIVRLIGTVGNRAVLLVPDGTTAVIGVGEEFDVGGGKSGKLVSIGAKSADIMIDGKKKTLALGAAPELTAKAQSEKSADNSKSGGGDSASLSSSQLSVMPVSSSAPGIGGGAPIMGMKP